MKNKMIGKGKLLVVALIATLAIIFLWWVGNRTEQIAQRNLPTASTIETKEKGGFLATLGSFFGRNNKSKITDTESNPTRDETVPPVQPLVFTIADIKTTENETSSSIATYGKQMAEVMKPLGTIRPNEGKLLLQVLEQNDLQASLKIYQAAKVHFRILSNLLEMTVPASATPLHLKIIQLLSLTTAQLANMSKVEVDPALSISNGLAYQTTALELFTAIAAMNDYFATKGITFAKEDRITIYINVDEE